MLIDLRCLRHGKDKSWVVGEHHYSLNCKEKRFILANLWKNKHVGLADLRGEDLHPTLRKNGPTLEVN